MFWGRMVYQFSSVQFSSVTQSCLTLCNAMDCSTPGFPVFHHLPEFAQTHVHWVGDAMSSSVIPFSCLHSFPTRRSSDLPLAALWTAASQVSLSFTISQSLLKLMSIESMMPSNPLVLCHPLLLWPSIFPSIRVFSSESTLLIGGQSIGASASASVLPVNIQDWFPLGWTGWISLQSKGLSRVFFNTAVQKNHFFNTQLSL